MTTEQLLSANPCHWCSGPVALIGGECLECEAVHREPQPGPQTAFIDSPATFRIFGGGMGSGKTYAGLLDWLVRGAFVEGSNGLCVRRHSRDIMIGGGLWDEAKKVFEGTGAHFRGGSAMDVHWPSSGSTLSFRHLDDKGIERFKGPAFTWILIEEASEVNSAAILWLMQRMRSSVGIESTIALTTNPAPLHAMRQWVGWYIGPDGQPLRERSGVVTWMLRHTRTDKQCFGETPEEAGRLADADPADAMSFTYVPSLLEDNRALNLGDPGYRKKFAQVPTTERRRNLGGNWDAVDEKGGMLRWSWWGRVSVPLGPIVRKCRAWDKAATQPTARNPDPDYTVGVLMGWDVHNNWYVLDVVACREEPPGVDKLMGETAAADGVGVIQCIPKDPAAAGKSDVLHTSAVLRAALPGVRVVTRAPLKAKKVRAQTMSNELRLGQRSKAAVLELVEVEADTFEHQPRGFILEGAWISRPYSDAGSGPETMGALFTAMVYAFPDPEDEAKDDIVDAMSDAHAVLSDVPRRSVGSRWAALS